MDTTETVERIDADLSTPDVAIRILATAGDADQRYPVPSKQRFKDAGEGVIEADDLAHVAGALIADATLPLGHLAALRIGYLWADRGGNAGGFPCFGRLIKASKALLHYAEIDYLVMLSADHLREAKATRWQVEALIGHQLGHVEMLTTEKGEDRYSVKGHDFEGFAFEFRRWGAYLPNMVVPAQSAASAVQMGMVWEETEDDDDEEGDYDPSVDLPAGVDAEAGPVPGGAPEVDWAERSGIAGEAWGDPAFEWGAEESVPDFSEHLANVRENFATKVIRLAEEPETEVEVCARCGVGVLQHDPEVCSGGTPETRKRRSRKIPHDFSQIAGEATGAAPERLPVIGETALSGLYDAATLPHANGNGNHDKDDVAALIADPDKVMAKVAEVYDLKIAYVVPPGERIGTYQHPTSGEIYDTQHVESLYRRALAGRTVV